ncbi:hypothetical protein GE09DRAFT_1241729 [Coniochaeta sp. 2T2.1]|nr:hypothetical protein GE09DRAFT_1241729 [Coniochaeta sp. 2T2.1]
MPKKWSYDHIIFVLSHGKKFTASMIVERFKARFPGVGLDAEQAKYIRHHYRNNPKYSGAASDIASPTATAMTTNQVLATGVAGSSTPAGVDQHDLTNVDYGRQDDDHNRFGIDAGAFPAQDQPVLYNPLPHQSPAFHHSQQIPFHHAAATLQPAVNQGFGYQPPVQYPTSDQALPRTAGYFDPQAGANPHSHPEHAGASTGVQWPHEQNSQLFNPVAPAQRMGWEQWYDGPHGSCELFGTHRHDSAGGIYFESEDALYNTIFGMNAEAN